MTKFDPYHWKIQTCANCQKLTSHKIEFTTDEDTQLFGMLQHCEECGYKTWADWDHPTPQDIIDGN